MNIKVRTVRNILSTASVVCLATIIAAASARAMAAGAAVAPARMSDRWTSEELATIASMRLSQLPPLAKDVSNAVDGSPAAKKLGKRLFNDVRFSRNNEVSCASCHDPVKSFQDGLPLGRGVGVGSRRSMPIVAAGFSPWLFWDGRKDSLWAQALGPLEDSVEHGGNRSQFAHLVQAHYRSEYEAIFQSIPDLSRVPPHAGPQGSPAEMAAWNRLDKNVQHDVSRVFANIGKSIAAFEKSLAFGESRFDRYADAIVQRTPVVQPGLTPMEIRGLRIFIGKGQCATCHNGPLLTDQHFHNTGVSQRDPSRPDHGRAAALTKVKQDEFNCLGVFSDAKPAQCAELRYMVRENAALEGAFKTPSLRNVALRAPYMHAGQLSSLENVIAHYLKAPAATVGHSELAHGAVGHTDRKPIRLSPQEVDELVSFLGTLSGPIIEDAEK
jgi:cytochrome c peroxidase